MSRILRISYVAATYLVGLVGLTYFILFLGPFDILPRHIDTLTPTGGRAPWLINIGLMVAFGLQHSIMARPWFKEKWTRLVPKELERATYVLISGLFMFAFALFWQPFHGMIWEVEGTVGRALLIGGWAAGFLVLVAASFMLDHFRLFGVKQLVEHLRGQEAPAPQFKQIMFYRFVRHPIQTGILMTLWCAPTMTRTHLVLAIAMTMYISIGLHFEERALLRTLGSRYARYRAEVGMVLPRPAFLGGCHVDSNEAEDAIC